MPGPVARRTVVLGGASSEGTPTEPDPPAGLTDDELWSLMHMGFGDSLAVPLPGASLDVDDQEMLVGLYSGIDY
jgi:hypothetical protein